MINFVTKHRLWATRMPSLAVLPGSLPAPAVLPAVPNPAVQGCVASLGDVYLLPREQGRSVFVKDTNVIAPTAQQRDVSGPHPWRPPA